MVVSQRHHLSLYKVNQGLGRNKSRMRQCRREPGVVWGLGGIVLSCCRLLGFQKCTISKGLPAAEYKNDTFQSDGIFLWRRILEEFFLSLSLCLWTPCLISIRECPSWVGAGWQLVFVFRLKYVCLIQSLIVCGVLFNGPKGTTSAQIAHFIQDRTMMQSDLQPTQDSTKAHKHTHTNTHPPNQSVGQTLLGIIGEKKKDEKINRPVATLK